MSWQHYYFGWFVRTGGWAKGVRCTDSGCFVCPFGWGRMQWWFVLLCMIEGFGREVVACRSERVDIRVEKVGILAEKGNRQVERVGIAAEVEVEGGVIEVAIVIAARRRMDLLARVVGTSIRVAAI